MGISLIDAKSGQTVFIINFWNWRVIVEEVKRLNVLPEDVVERLHQPFCGFGLSSDQCALLAEAIDKTVLPSLKDGQRILWDGTKTNEPDSYKFDRENFTSNYSTSRDVLERFSAGIRECGGFLVC